MGLAAVHFAMAETTIPGSVYESVFRTSSVGGYLLSALPEFVILAVNDAFLACARREREDLLGKPLFPAFPEARKTPRAWWPCAARC
jgi:hypothetical protein